MPYSTAIDRSPFDEAYEQFLDSLPEKERVRYAPCATSQEFFSSLKNLQCLSGRRQKARSKKLIGIIEKFHNQLEPFFAVIGIYAQANQFACIAWGSLRLILQVIRKEREKGLISIQADLMPSFSSQAALQHFSRTLYNS